MEPWQRLDLASADEARRLLQACCGSTRWVERMLACRPFGGLDRLLSTARTEWFALTPADWREAFGHHPAIGDRDSLRRRFPTTHHLSEREQSGVAVASEAVLEALSEGNRTYAARFGYMFIVCATGRTADEMLAILRARLDNDAETELRVAAEEQAKITALRLEKLE
jgi:2-oxo-4-hydroxy-4-carboxy-5-ureidoimidazoline decarboxylase